jgi:hypothetical protein
MKSHGVIRQKAVIITTLILNLATTCMWIAVTSRGQDPPVLHGRNTKRPWTELCRSGKEEISAIAVNLAAVFRQLTVIAISTFLPDFTGYLYFPAGLPNNSKIITF